MSTTCTAFLRSYAQFITHHSPRTIAVYLVCWNVFSIETMNKKTHSHTHKICQPFCKMATIKWNFSMRTEIWDFRYRKHLINCIKNWWETIERVRELHVPTSDQWFWSGPRLFVHSFIQSVCGSSHLPVKLAWWVHIFSMKRTKTVYVLCTGNDSFQMRWKRWQETGNCVCVHVFGWQGLSVQHIGKNWRWRHEYNMEICVSKEYANTDLGEIL